MTILSKVLTATGFIYGIYHINNLVQEFKEYTAEQGYTLGDFGFEQSAGELARQTKKKQQQQQQQMRGGQNQAQLQQMYFEELSQNSQRGKAAVDKGDYKMAFSCFERIVELGQEYPPFATYGRNATLYLVKIAQEAKEDELFIKYCKQYIDSFENPSIEECGEIVKCIDDFSAKLGSIGRVSEAIDVIKATMKRFKFSDRNKASLLSILASTYAKSDKFAKKELSTLLKGLKVAQSSKDSVLIMNCNLELYEYYSKTNNIEKMKECVEKVEDHMEPQLAIPAYRILGDFSKKYGHWEQYLELIGKLIIVTRNLKGQLDQANIEAIIISYQSNIAQSYMERGMPEEAIKIYDELKQNEYLSFAPTSESKYLTVKESSSKDGVQTISIVQKTGSTLPDEFKDSENILVVEFENSYEIKKSEEEEEKKEEEKETKEHESEEQKPVEQEKSTTEESEEQKPEVEEEVVVVEKVEQVVVEEVSAEKVEEIALEIVEEIVEKVEQQEEEIKEEQEESEVVEPVAKVEQEDDESEEEVVIKSKKIVEIESEEEKSIQIAAEINYDVVPKNIIEKPFEKLNVFENDSSLLDPRIGYLAKVSLYNNDKSKLIDSLYQLLPIQKPKHKLLF